MSLVLRMERFEEGDRERQRQLFWRSHPVLPFKGKEWEVSDLETDREAVDPCHFQPEVHSAMSDRDNQKHEQKMATMEAKKCSMTEAGESLHGVALVPPSATYKF